MRPLQRNNSCLILTYKFHVSYASKVLSVIKYHITRQSFEIEMLVGDEINKWRYNSGLSYLKGLGKCKTVILGQIWYKSINIQQ